MAVGGSGAGTGGAVEAIAPQLQGVLPEAEAVVMLAVDSSNVSAIGFDCVNQVLVVDFHKGGRYRYFQVPQGVFEDFLAASSKSQFLHYHVKRRFDYERVCDSFSGE